MLSIPSDQIQVVYENQPLLQEPEDYPAPGAADAEVESEEENNAS